MNQDKVISKPPSPTRPRLSRDATSSFLALAGLLPAPPHKPPTGESRLPPGPCWTHTASARLTLQPRAGDSVNSSQTRGHRAFMALEDGGVGVISSAFPRPGANGEAGLDKRA